MDKDRLRPREKEWRECLEFATANIQADSTQLCQAFDNTLDKFLDASLNNKKANSVEFLNTLYDICERCPAIFKLKARDEDSLKYLPCCYSIKVAEEMVGPVEK